MQLAEDGADDGEATEERTRKDGVAEDVDAQRSCENENAK